MILGVILITTYEKMRDLGLVRSKRDYSRRWLGRGETYLRDLQFKGRDGAIIPASTVTALRMRLKCVSQQAPTGVKLEIDAVIASIDQGIRIADLLSRQNCSTQCIRRPSAGL